MVENLPGLTPYPNQEILKSLDQGSLDSIISTWARIVLYYVNSKSGDYPDSLSEFIESYIREVVKDGDDFGSVKNNTNHKPSSKGKGKITSPKSILRYGVLILISEKHVIRNPSPEFLWNFISLYGSLNYTRVVEYVKYVSNNNPVILSKVGKLALFYIKESLKSNDGGNNHDDTINNQNHIIQVIAILISDSSTSEKLLTDNWYAELFSIESDLANKIIQLCQNGISLKQQSASASTANPDDIKLLIELFPNLTINSAENVLNSHPNVEAASSYLLENPLIIEELNQQNNDDEDAEIKLYKPLKKKTEPSNPTTAALEATLRLIYEADEDERDDTYDDAPHTEEEAASTLALQKVERQLWEIYNHNPNAFKRESRKTKPRLEIKKFTNWSDEQIEGWARILEKNPRRRAYLEERFMFQGNFPNLRHEAFKKEGSPFRSEPTSEISSEQSNDDEEDDVPNRSSESNQPKPQRPPQQQSNPPPNTSKQQTKNQRQRSDKYKSIQRQKQKDKHTKKMGLE